MWTDVNYLHWPVPFDPALLSTLYRVATNLEYSGISLNMENSGNSVQPRGKIVQSILVRHSNICVKPWMKVIITYTFCCDNLWKSKFMALENSGNFLLLLCGHPVVFLRPSQWFFSLACFADLTSAGFPLPLFKVKRVPHLTFSLWNEIMYKTVQADVCSSQNVPVWQTCVFEKKI